MQTQQDQHVSTAIIAAHLAGETTAKAIKIGDVFMGAHPEADKLGFRAPLLRSIFTGSYLDHLPREIRVDRVTNVIVALGDGRTPARAA